MSWLAGFVKEVQSGDTLVIASASAVPNGKIAEKRLNLASLSAPRMPRRDGSATSEEFAWESREFLRKLAIGRKCVFQVEYKIDASDRDFGAVCVERDGTHIDLGLAVARAGWAQVRGSKDAKTQSKDIDALKSAQEDAEEAGRGIYCTDSVAKATSTFSFDTISASTGAEAIATFGKGVPIPAVVDVVLTGTTLKLVTIPERIIITLSLAGAQSPNVRKGADGTLEGDTYGREAKAAAEFAVLNREVRVVLYSADSGGTRVYGELVYPSSGAPASLAATLIASGAARYVDWSARLLPVTQPAALVTAAALRKAELKAQAASAGMWALIAPPQAARGATEAAATGRVLEVVSGDTLVVALEGNREVRLSLASIRAPRLRPGGSTTPEPFAREAKDYLRANCIGAECSVTLEYTRTVEPTITAPGASGPNADAGERSEVHVMQFGNVEVQSKAKGLQQLAEVMVRRGYAAVQGGREGDDRSAIFGALMTAEESARSRRAGIHSGKEPAPTRLNDVSVPGSGNRAKQYLPFFQRGGSVPCVVEHVMSGSRLRLLVAKEGAVIAFSPSGVRTPSRGAPARGGQPMLKAEPLGEEAYQFVRRKFMQREGMVTVESVDRSGTFLGRLVVGGEDLSLALLDSGLGSLHPSFSADRIAGAAALEAAQERAQAARRGTWKDYNPETAAEEEAAARLAAVVRPATVTHVESGVRFFVQSLDEPRVEWVAGECKAAAEAPPPARVPLSVGQKVLAKFSVDGKWYRGSVEAVFDRTGTSERARVYFLDYGNKEMVAAADVRPMDAALAAVAPLASAVRLAYVRVPDLNDDVGEAAADYLAELVGNGRRLTMRVVGKARPALGVPTAADPGDLEVVLTDEGVVEDLAGSVQAKMLRAGFARLQAVSSLKGPAARAAAKELRPCMEEGLRRHIGIFCYGDPGDSDDE